MASCKASGHGARRCHHLDLQDVDGGRSWFPTVRELVCGIHRWYLLRLHDENKKKMLLNLLVFLKKNKK
jgi:hypothetical protein